MHKNSRGCEQISEYLTPETHHISLQVPPHLLADVLQLSNELKGKRADIQVKILADSYSDKCCIDSVAYSHTKTELLVHFGHACFTNLKSIPFPILYIFSQIDCNVECLFQAIQAKYSSLETVNILLADVYLHIYPTLLRKCVDGGYINVSIAHVQTYIEPYTDLENCNTDPDHEWFMGYSFKKSDHNLYVGPESEFLTHLAVKLLSDNLCVYDPAAKCSVISEMNLKSLFGRRYAVTQKSKDAKTFGIVVGTVGAESQIKLIKSLKNLLKSKGKKSYTISVGQPSPQKLGNFLEIDAFILIACPLSTITNTSREMAHEYLKGSFITPFELLVGISGDWVTTHKGFSCSIDGVADLIEQYMKDNCDCDTADEPYFSLSTGKLSSHAQAKVSNLEPVTSDAVTTRGDAEVVKFMLHSPAAVYLSNRTYKGLDTSTNLESQMKQVTLNIKGEIVTVEEGRNGIARGYTHEFLEE